VEGGAALDQFAHGQACERLAQFGTGGDHDCLDLVERLRARLDSRVLGHLEHSDHLDVAVAVLGDGRCDSGQHRPGGHLCVDGVVLAYPTSGCPVGTVDLHDTMATAGQKPGKSCSVGTGALDGEDLH